MMNTSYLRYAIIEAIVEFTRCSYYTCKKAIEKPKSTNYKKFYS
jgi:hypothetical protein